MTKLDHEDLIRFPVDALARQDVKPDELYDSNRIRIARWGNVIAWCDGPRTGVDEFSSVLEAEVEFSNALAREREG